MNNKLILLALPILLLAAAGNACAAVVTPGESLQQAVLAEVDQFCVFHKQREELVVQATVKLPDQAGSIDRIAFVIPVPGTPDSAVLESAPVLRDIRAFTRRSSFGLPAPPEVVGEEQPSVISAGSKGPLSDALNRWLALNGLQTIRLERLRPYDDGEWSFVVQRAYTSGYSGNVLLRPVRISFNTRNIVFPLRLMQNDEKLVCRLAVMTKGSLNTEPLEEHGFALGESAGPVRLAQLPESVEMLVNRAGSRFSVFKEMRRGNVYLFSAAAEVHDAAWDSEITIAEPRIPLLSTMQNILAVGAAVAVVLLMNRAKKKTNGDSNGGSE